MEIRQIIEKDLKEFQRVFTKVLRVCFLEYPPQVVDFFVGEDFNNAFLKKKIANWDYVVLLAFEQGKIIGFLVMEKLYGGVSFCTWLGVESGGQGKGIGSALLKAWEEMVLEAGGHKLMLIAPSKEARQFYRTRGFKEEGFEEKSWFGLDYWIFGKLISQPKPALFLTKIESSGVTKK
jgi:GNAT superfamily N-acetyltransferase